MSEIQLATLKSIELAARKATSPITDVSGMTGSLWAGRDGALVTQNWLTAKTLEGKVFGVNGGAGSTVITFAGAYDADAPDLHIHIPYGTTIIPVYLEVIFEAVGTEATMEIIALASSTGDSSVTGTASTIRNMRIGGGASGCTATAAVDAAGCTDPNAGSYLEFWKYQRPLTDTVATTENDRLPLVFTWSALTNPTPIIVGSSTGSALAVYAASQAGTGFITAIWVEEPSVNV
uniref:Uncharacterized protein n=1 Tax=viral metagenome TaxID=1070528 RepID=A0A6M3K4E1_9ZZZZ